MPSPIRLAIAGVGNCASSLVQGITYYRDAEPDDVVPGLMHVELGRLPRARPACRWPPSTWTRPRSGTDLGKAIHAGLNNTVRFAEVGELGVTVQRGPTFDGLGHYYREMVEESPAEPVDVAEALREARADVLVSYLPVGSEEAQRHYAQACLDAGVAFVNAIPVFIASDPEWARKFRDAGMPDRGRRHQEPGRLHHRPPHPHPPLRGPRPGARPHLPAQLRRQHGLQEHARARAPRVQEDLQDPGRHQPDGGQRARRRRRPRRPVRPRAVAEGPQVGLHPHGGAQLRRRAAQPRAQARGVGLPQLGRRHHRRRALRQAGARPRHRRPAPRPLGLLHEVAAGAVPRRRGARPRRGIRRRRGPGDWPED